MEKHIWKFWFNEEIEIQSIYILFCNFQINHFNLHEIDQQKAAYR